MPLLHWFQTALGYCCQLAIAGILLTVAGQISVVGPTANVFGADQVADYSLHVRAVLAERCYACHGALKQEGGLRLDSAANLEVGGDSGPAIAAHEAHNSLLVQRVRHSEADLRMPPEGQPLTESQIQAIEAWIEAGAPAPLDDQPQPDPLQHWAFQAPRRPELPPAADDSGNAVRTEVPPGQTVPLRHPVPLSHPVDRLLADKQRQLGIQPLSPAPYRTLVRRLYIDLLGIPPTPQQMQAALNDRSEAAYENLVDQLLSQAEYGERWGRHWMDVWRYSDWYGRRTVPDVMNSYPQIWRWRDWIVRSLNEDKGYDQMILQMLAADELNPQDDQNIVATGFLVRNWFKWNYETWMKDNVEHTGKAFLGLTMNCAHCHDHKYDPITHEDYFRFQAFFEPLELRHDRVAGQADPGPFKKYVYAESYGPISTGAIRVFDEKLDAKTYLYLGGDSRNRVDGQEPLEPAPPEALVGSNFQVSPISLPVEAYYPGIKEFVRREERGKVADELQKAEANYDHASKAMLAACSHMEDLLALSSQPLSASSRPSEEALVGAERAQCIARLDQRVALSSLSVAQARQSALDCRIAADDARYRGLGDPELMARRAHQAEKHLAWEAAQLAEIEAQRAVTLALHQQASAAADKLDEMKNQLAKAQEALLAARSASDAAQRELLSNETSYTPLSPVYPATSTGRRAALARWIANEQNPLTARVAVNHIWLRHFGQALVDTPDNLGHQGRKPLLPEILDWLAVEFMENGWSIKHLHRTIVTSQAYRRSSNPPPEHDNFAIDRDNQYYWRWIPQRMQAETVRDSVLACSGALDKTLGGHEIDNAQWVSSPRRSIYFTIHGEAKMQFLDTFDGPNVCDCYRRTATVLPQQALAMTNSQLLVSNGRRLAAAIAAEESSSAEGQALNDAQYVDRVFEVILNRPANELERAAALEFLDQQRAIFAQASPEELAREGGPEVLPASRTPEQRARENLAISLFSHNDFVTVR